MIEIISVRAAPREAVVNFFRAIDSPEIKAHFHPHDFGESRARWLCSYSGKDEYYFVVHESTIVAYGHPLVFHGHVEDHRDGGKSLSGMFESPSFRLPSSTSAPARRADCGRGT